MKAVRNIIVIDEEKCNGCGACVNGCHEGALQLIDRKARIVSELYCDGLGACIGDCPVGAITLVQKEAEPYDEVAVMDRISPKGEATILAHLKHLKDHGEHGFLKQGVDYILSNKLKVDLSFMKEDKALAQVPAMASGCPGSMARSFETATSSSNSSSNSRSNSSSNSSSNSEQVSLNHEKSVPNSALTHWPVQLHLINPTASYFSKEDIVLAADCTAFAYGNFHESFLKGRKLAIACPKLDSNKEVYINKLVVMIDTALINTLTVVIMEVPCCGGLMQIAKAAVEQSNRKIPIKKIVIGVQGELKTEEWV